MPTTSREQGDSRDARFWRAYFEILHERVPLVDRWRDGSMTWHPRVVEKLLWYSDIPNTKANRQMAHTWLIENAAKTVARRSAPRRSSEKKGKSL
jgi:hypothetical protein